MLNVKMLLAEALHVQAKGLHWQCCGQVVLFEIFLHGIFTNFPFFNGIYLNLPRKELISALFGPKCGYFPCFWVNLEGFCLFLGGSGVDCTKTDPHVGRMHKPEHLNLNRNLIDL